MVEYYCLPVYWKFSSANPLIDPNRYIANLKELNEDYLSKGWKIERTNTLRDTSTDVVLYILKRDVSKLDNEE